MAERPLKPLPLCPAAHPPRHSAGFVKPLPRCTPLPCSGGPVCSERCGGRLRRGPPHHLHRGRTAVHRLGRPAGEGGGSRHSRRSRGRRCSKSVGMEWLGGVEGRRGRCIQEAGASEARAPACGAGPALPACWPAGMLCCAGPTGAGAPGAPCLLLPAPKPNNRHPTPTATPNPFRPSQPPLPQYPTPPLPPPLPTFPKQTNDALAASALPAPQILHHSLGKAGDLDFELNCYKQVGERGGRGNH